VATILEFIVLVLVGVVLLGIASYVPSIGFLFQVLVGLIGVIFLLAGIVAILRKSAND
jgi:hypothetical protein